MLLSIVKPNIPRTWFMVTALHTTNGMHAFYAQQLDCKEALVNCKYNAVMISWSLSVQFDDGEQMLQHSLLSREVINTKHQMFVSLPG